VVTCPGVPPERMSTDVEARKTPFCGQRVFIANDRESTGTARFSPELRNSQPRCRTTKNGTHWSYQDLRFWATVRVDGLSTRPRSAWRAPTEHISNPTLYPQLHHHPHPDPSRAVPNTLPPLHLHQHVPSHPTSTDPPNFCAAHLHKGARIVVAPQVPQPQSPWVGNRC